MKPHHLGKLKKDYDLTGFADPMVYKYGCKPGECQEFVYKLDIIENGVRKTASWDYTVGRCDELGLQLVPELDCFTHTNVEVTLARINALLANDKLEASVFDNSHITEGVCVRVEEFDKLGQVIEDWKVFKHKSFLFGVLEGYARENNEVEAEELEYLENDKEER